jgi:hypothetical protein
MKTNAANKPDSSDQTVNSLSSSGIHSGQWGNRERVRVHTRVCIHTHTHTDGINLLVETQCVK